MPEVVYYVGSSLDGYIATEDDGVEWLNQFQPAGEDHGFFDLYASFDGLLMGSRSYEVALKQPPWRAPDKPSWVFTKRKLPVAHPTVTLTSEEPSRLLESLDDRGLKRLWLMGGGKLAASFRMQGLITHYIIGIVPFVLGGGIPFLAAAPRQDSLSLVESKAYPSGIVLLSYEVKPGS